jgi:hypothetical protein
MPRPIVLDRPCLNCRTVFTPFKKQPCGRMVRDNSRKLCSPNCRKAWQSNNPVRKARISAAFTGAKHPNWQGGKSYFNRISKRGPGWKAAALKARERDNNSCRDCGKGEKANGRKMDVHHIRPFHDYATAAEANALANLLSLCKVCHRKREALLKGQQMTLALFGEKSGHLGQARGEKINTNKLRSADVLAIRHAYAAGETGVEIGRRFGVAATNVSAIVNGETWKHLPIIPMPLDRKSQHVPARGAACGSSKISEDKAIEIKRLIPQISNKREIARRAGVSKAIVYQIAGGKTWGHVSAAT